MKPRAYYNDNDAKVCAWVRELIKRGLVMDGDVDERSIKDVKPDELKGYTRIHLFCGIAGWDYALQLASWPDDVPVLTNSCPCQSFSNAGQRKGIDDPRHLWPDAFRIIQGLRPVTIFGEQVEAAIRFGWLDGVFTDLEGENYSCGAAILGAHSVRAPHIRQRIYWLANTRSKGVCRSTGGGNNSETETWNRKHEHDSSPSSPLRGGLAVSESQQHNGSRDTRRGRGELTDECGLGNSNEPRPQGRNGAELSECSGEQIAGERGSSGGLGQSALVGNGEASLEGGSGQSEAERRERVGGGSSAWSDSELLPCRDGKSRRTQSGICPLAHGVPARMVRLRGYGNAIVPQVAAAFIKAAMTL